ncbi:hypothetical protein F0562_030691 [Nyssa sinensis]|uniref:Gelsolin-like domain-containing protein n=1 Tax=Nyssa sinensis TaxID=561372 RepID=A0A5J5AZI6_9ASTE|nr:hypothetical protein F0562_030691 [Nyssa sinensis]
MLIYSSICGNLNTLARRLEGMLRVILTYSHAAFQKVTEIYNFNEDDLMTEDIFVLDCHSDIFVWVGQQVDSKNRTQAVTIGEVPDYAIE